MAPRDVTATLQKVSALRALCLRLPHLTTPQEQERLRRFEVLVTAPHTATVADLEALVVGWRRWWRHAYADRIREMAARLPAGRGEGDRRLASFAAAAR